MTPRYYGQKRYRVIYYTQRHDWPHLWDEIDTRKDADRTAVQLAMVPNVTYAYVYDGERHARVFHRGEPRP